MTSTIFEQLLHDRLADETGCAGKQHALALVASPLGRSPELAAWRRGATGPLTNSHCALLHS